MLPLTILTYLSSHLCPGSQVLLKDITNPDLPDHERIDVTKIVRDMTVEEWATFVRAFDRWPFAPEVLFLPNDDGSTFIEENNTGPRDNRPTQ